MAFLAGDEEGGRAADLGSAALSTDEEQRQKAPEMSGNGVPCKAATSPPSDRRPGRPAENH